MNTKDKGDLAEAMLLGALLKHGYSVLKPFGDNQRYDLVIEHGGVFQRVQCKTGNLKDGAIIFKTCSTTAHRGGTSQDYIGAVEFFGVYCRALDKCYLVPVIGARCAGSLRVADPRNGQAKGIRHAKDFEL